MDILTAALVGAGAWVLVKGAKAKPSGPVPVSDAAPPPVKGVPVAEVPQAPAITPAQLEQTTTSIKSMEFEAPIDSHDGIAPICISENCYSSPKTAPATSTISTQQQSDAFRFAGGAFAWRW